MIHQLDGTGIGSTTFFAPYDLAFTLSGSTTDTVATPEPSPLILLCTGLMGLLAFAVRSKWLVPPTSCYPSSSASISNGGQGDTK